MPAGHPPTARIALPWRPHGGMAPSATTLGEWVVDAALAARIGVFNATTCTTHLADPRFPRVLRTRHVIHDVFPA